MMSKKDGGLPKPRVPSMSAFKSQNSSDTVFKDIHFDSLPKTDSGTYPPTSTPPVVKTGVAKNNKPKKGEVRREIWKVTSFYLSEGQSWTSILYDAREVARVANVERTLTVAHKHFLGQPCSKSCKGF